MELFTLVTTFIFQTGVTLGVGSSTFALTFYFAALRDGTIDSSERRFMHIVYFILRIGMTLIATGLALSLLGEPIITEPQTYILAWVLLGIITINAVLMTLHAMPMKYGPVIAGGSWYSLFFLTTLPAHLASLEVLLALYVVFLVFVYILLQMLKSVLVPQKA